MNTNVELRRAIVKIIDRGCGARILASTIGIALTSAQDMIYTYEAVGREIFLSKSVYKEYSYDVKLAAVRDYVDNGLTRREVMAKHSIASVTSLKQWARKYREGGPDALLPKPRGRKKSSPTKTLSREQELERENRLLKAENAYLKKLRALEAQK